MPVVVRGITYLIPARYFVALVKGIFLRGVGLATLWADALFLLVFALVVLAVAIRRTRKTLG
jgi:ABC-2 type transport system permease protein